MAQRTEANHSVGARSDRLSDAQLGLLLGDLRLSTEAASEPAPFRQALAAVARAAQALPASTSRHTSEAEFFVELDLTSEALAHA